MSKDFKINENEFIIPSQDPTPNVDTMLNNETTKTSEVVKKVKQPKRKHIFELENKSIYTKGKNKEKNKQVSFKVNEELRDFITKIPYITARPSTKTEYLNALIRKDMLELLNLPIDTPSDELLKQWEIYKRN